LNYVQKFFRIVLTAALVVAFQPRAWTDGPSNEQIDAALNDLTKLDPAAIIAKVNELSEKVKALQAEADQIKAQAAEKETRAAEIAKLLEGYAKTMGAVQGAAPAPQAAAPAAEQMAPAPAPEMKTAVAEAAKATINFEDTIKPIFKQRCMSCHNDDKKRGGLSLMTHASMMAGGGSGVVLTPGDAEGSRLFRLVSKKEEPVMPPSGAPLDDAQLNLIREWIQAGAPATADAKVAMAADASAEKKPVFVAAAIAEGPPPMPEATLQPPAPRNGERKIVARAVATSPRSPLAAICGDRQVLLYNTETFQPLGALPFPEGDVFSMTFSVNGELLLAAGGQEGDSGIAVLWNIRKGERVGTFGEGFDTILAADISPDHRLIALGGPERKVKVFSAETGDVLYQCESHTDWILSVKFSPDGELLATADRGGGLYLWQAANGRSVEQLQGHTGAINDLSYTVDSTILASAGADGTVQVWDTWKYSKIRGFGAHSGAVLSVNISGNGQIVTAGIDGTTKRWDLNGTNLSTYTQMSDWVYQARFTSNNGVVLGGVWNGDVEVWNAEDGKQLAKLATAP
jgi:mono/diheme cytochrome c family protein